MWCCSSCELNNYNEELICKACYHLKHGVNTTAIYNYIVRLKDTIKEQDAALQKFTDYKQNTNAEIERLTNTIEQQRCESVRELCEKMFRKQDEFTESKNDIDIAQNAQNNNISSNIWALNASTLNNTGLWTHNHTNDNLIGAHINNNSYNDNHCNKRTNIFSWNDVHKITEEVMKKVLSEKQPFAQVKDNGLYDTNAYVVDDIDLNFNINDGDNFLWTKRNIDECNKAEYDKINDSNALIGNINEINDALYSQYDDVLQQLTKEELILTLKEEKKRNDSVENRREESVINNNMFQKLIDAEFEYEEEIAVLVNKLKSIKEDLVNIKSLFGCEIDELLAKHLNKQMKLQFGLLFYGYCKEFINYKTIKVTKQMPEDILSLIMEFYPVMSSLVHLVE